MHERTFADGSILYDDTGDWVTGSGVAFPPATIVPSENAPFWRTDLRQWCHYRNGAWSTDAEFAGTASITGEATFEANAHFEAGLHVHGSEDAGGIKWFAGQGDQTTEAHRHEGSVSVDLDLAGVDHKDSAADLIPARAWVHAIGVQILTTFTGGAVAKLDIGVTGGAADGLVNDGALLTAGQFLAASLALGLTDNSNSGGITVAALTAGDAPAVVTTGKVRVTLWYSRIDGPDGSTYA